MTKKNLFRLLSLTAALAVCLAAFSGCAGAPSAQSVAPEGGKIILSINPEIEISYDADGKVTALSARNAEATKILESYKGFEGKETKTVVSELVDLIGAAGYFVEEIDGGRRNITIEIEKGSRLPDNVFIEDVIAEVKSKVENSDWQAPIDLRGITDYRDTDYGPDNDGVTDYTDYKPAPSPAAETKTSDSKAADSKTSASKSDSKISDSKSSDGKVYNGTDYGVTDYKDTDYGPDNDGVTDYTDYRPASADSASAPKSESSKSEAPKADPSPAPAVKGTDYGRTDYNDTDYGPDNDGVTDYGKTDYGKTDYGKTDYGKTDYGK